MGRSSDEDPKLVTEDQDLEVLGAVISATLASANEEMGQRLDDEVQERERERESIGSSYESARM